MGNKYYIVEYFAELENAKNDGVALVVDKCINNFDERKEINYFGSYGIALSFFDGLQSEVFPTHGIYYSVGAKVYTIEHNNPKEKGRQIMNVAGIVDARQQIKRGAQ